LGKKTPSCENELVVAVVSARLVLVVARFCVEVVAVFEVSVDEVVPVDSNSCGSTVAPVSVVDVALHAMAVNKTISIDVFKK
jgi:hypothetical protein